MFKKILSEMSPMYGFCSFDDISSHLIDCRAKERIPENSKTVIVALFPYNLGDGAYNGANISKYAVVPDYHDTLGSILNTATQKLKSIFPNEEFVTFTDNSPIPEVTAGVLAGLGVRGVNGMLINETYGSWIFIGEIVTTLFIQPEDITNKKLTCSQCGLCMKSCPTHAIGKNGINKSICLSDITQRKGELDAEMTELIKKSNCAWGCDICQNVCPLNLKVKAEPIDEFKSNVELTARTHGDIKGRAYAWRGKKVISRNLEILKNE